MRVAIPPLLFALMLTSCATPAPSSEVAPPTLEDETARVSRLLRARHASPEAVILPNEHTETALLECSREDALLVVRVRAILALAAYPSRPTRERLLELLPEGKAAPSLRAAAAEAAVELDPRPGSELWGALAALRDDPDPRVQLALGRLRAAPAASP